MYRTIVARLPDYALQRRAMPHVGTSMAAPLEIDSRRGNRPQHSDPHRHTGAGPPHRATAGPPRTLEPPPQAHPRTPHRAHLAYSTALKLPLGPRNKKSAQTATFLRLAIVPNSPIANRGIKTQAIDRAAAYYHPAATKKEPLIAKKLQKCRDFCFCDGRSCRNGPNCRNGLNATGQTYRSNSTETGQWSEPMISE